MRLEGLTHLLFVVYCVAAGMLLIFAPWGPLWERILAQAPPGGAVQLLSHPAVRAAASGFGLIHLVWALNDIEAFFFLSKPYGKDEAS